MVRRIIGFVVIAAALVGVLVWSQMRKPPEKVSGFIEAHDIRVGSRVGGRIARVLVEEGAKVKAGAVLIELEPYDIKEKIAQAQAVQAQAAATLGQRQAELARLQAGARVEEIAEAQARRDQLKAGLDKLVAGARDQEVAEAQALLAQAESQLKLAQQTFDRVKTAFASRNVSQDEMDNAANQLDVAHANEAVRVARLALLKEGSRVEDIAAAKAQLAEAEQALALMKNGSRVEDIAAAKAAVTAQTALLDAQKAAVGALQKQLEELRITSPADGTIEAVDIRPGDLLSANAPALTLLDSSELWVRAYLPENHLNISTGTKLRVTVDSFPGKDFEGTVSFISRDAEFTPGNVQTPEERSKQVFRLRVVLNDPGGELRAGMSADVWLPK